MIVKLHGVDEVMAALNPKAYERAVKSAFRDVGKSMRTMVSKSIRETYTVKQSRLAKQMHLYVKDKSVELHISNQAMSINAFQVRENNPTVRWRTKRGKVRHLKRNVPSIKVRKDSKPKKLGFFLHGKKGDAIMLRELRYNPGATVAEKKRMRSKLRKVYGMSAAAMTTDDKVQAALDDAIKRFDKRFAFWFDRYAWGNSAKHRQ